MKNLLVVAFHFPPDNTSTGVLRTYKFTEYLLRHDWRSHVISVPERLYTSRNPPGVDPVPAQISVERVWACDVKQAFGIRGVYPSWLGVPDRYWPWFFSGRRAAAEAIRRGSVQAVYTTYPVPTAHLIGLALRRRFGLPWIADFRDPWATEGERGIRASIESRLERAVVTAADRVVCNTLAMRLDFLARYPSQPPHKFVTITNGYDEKDFSSIVPEAGGKFQILYPGTIDPENRNPAGLFAGIRCAIDRGWLKPDDLRVVLLGCGGYADSPRFRQDLERHRLQQVVEIHQDRIPYRKALARMAGADVVVVLSENLGGDEAAHVQDWTAMQVPAKLYEYLRLGRPLLALVSEGAVKELLEKTGAGSPMSSRDIEQVAVTLKRYYEERRPAPPSLPPADPAIAGYSRENLTMLLARELDALTAAGRQARAVSASPRAAAK